MTTARDIMHQGVDCVPEHETLDRAAQMMRDHHVGSLPVCGADNRLKGIITDLFPMWLAWLAGAVAVVRVLAAFGVAAGLIAPGAVAMHIVIGVLVAAWLLATSWLLVREHLPAGSPTTARVVRHA